MKSNKYKIYQYILSNKTASRVELAEYLNISKPATTKLVNSLIELDYIYENKHVENKQVGRNKVELMINPNRLFIAGIEINKTEATVVITDITRKIMYEDVITYSHLTKDVLYSLCNKVNKKLHNYKNVVGVGITFPGIVVGDECVSLSVKDCENPCQYIKQILNYETRFSNNVNAIAKHINIFENQENFFIVKYGPGIGGNFMINDSLYLGKHNLSGEFGHIEWVEGSGSYCEICSNNKCLESIVGYQNLFEKLTNEKKENVHTADIINAVNDDNWDVVAEVFKKICFAINAVARTIDLDSILLMGGLFEDDRFFNLLKDVINNNYSLGSLYNINRVDNYSFIKKVAPTILLMDVIEL